MNDNFMRVRSKTLMADFPKFIALKVIPSPKKHAIIFWGHLGLGDAISSSCIIEDLLHKYRIVVIPSKKRNFDFLVATYGTWNGVVIVRISDDPFWENLEILKLKLRFRSPIKVVGHHLLQKNWNQEEISLNEQFNLIAGISPKQLTSTRFRKTCEMISQVAVPSKRFIFVDHHPGTDREIPSEFLKDASKRGLEIFSNDISIPLYRLLDVLDKAEEIHVIASAPLCFALTTVAKSPKKFYYRTKGQGPVVSEAYPDWIDIDLR